MVSTGRSLVAAGMGAIIEAAKYIPGAGIPIEAYREYRKTAEDQQFEEWAKRVDDRADETARKAQWYHTPEGQEFIKKIVANVTKLEHAEKMVFFVNAAVNGHRLGSDQAKRMKFVDMIVKLSKPALQVLAVAVEHDPEDHAVRSGELAGLIEWDPDLTDACVNELISLGVFSSVGDWRREGQFYQKGSHRSDGQPMLTSLTREFAAFISDKKCR
jgi:hypothetical protein